MKTKRFDWKSAVIFLAALAVLVSAVWKLCSAFLEYQKGRQEYGELEESAVLAGKEKEDFTVDFDKLRAVNPDIIGWIYFENMEISYPIVQGKDNEYYLNHTFYGEENKCGCIFMEVENAADFGDDNSFLYGHNMKDKSMFARLNEFQKKETYEKNPAFYIFTPKGVFQYKIYSCYSTELGGDSFLCRFKNQKEYGKWQKTVADKSLYDTGIAPNQNQKTVTLMTCTSAGARERFLVHGVLTQEETAEFESNQ
ncbi:MAG: class B sortase [Lachnospiraceae bacterium]|nr:class B sortase [Lachnospiraceae bacterium]